jgi:hypothetical protein
MSRKADHRAMHFYIWPADHVDVRRSLSAYLPQPSVCLLTAKERKEREENTYGTGPGFLRSLRSFAVT